MTSESHGLLSNPKRTRLQLNVEVNVKEAIKRGFGAASQEKITVDLADPRWTPELLETLAECIEVQRGEIWFRKLGVRFLVAPDVDALLAAVSEFHLRKLEEKGKNEEAERLAAKVLDWATEFMFLELLGKRKEMVSLLSSDLLDMYSKSLGDGPEPGESFRLTVRKIAERLRENTKYNSALTTYRQNMRVIRQLEEERRNNQLEEERRLSEEARRERDRWIEKHGSEQLKLLKAEKIAYDQTYFTERMIKERPGWVNAEVLPDWSELELADVPLGPLKFLQEMRKVSPTVQLKYVEFNEDELDDERYGMKEYLLFDRFLGRGIVYLALEKLPAE